MAANQQSSRWRRLWQNLALAGVTFLICAALLEVALRIAGYGNLEIYQPDVKLYWRLKPNQDCYTKIDRRPVHINSHGTRGPEFQTEKPANTVRILSLGDSRTFGWGLSDEETYSRRLEQLLREFGGRNLEPRTLNKPLTPALSPSDGERENRRQPAGETRRVEVINAGVNAWSYPQMLVFYRDFASAWKPDFVIVGEANLWTQFSEKNSPEFVNKFLGRVRLKNFLRRFAIYHYVIEVQLKDFYERHRTKFIPVDPQQDALFKEQQQSDPDAVFRTAMEDLCQAATRNNTKVVLAFIPTLDDLSSTNQSRVLTVKRAVSEKLGMPLVDLTHDLAAQGKALYLDADPVHLNAQGNAIVAQRLFESLTNHLTQ